MEGKTNFSKRLNQFDGFPWLILTSPLFYDRSTRLVPADVVGCAALIGCIRCTQCPH